MRVEVHRVLGFRYVRHPHVRLRAHRGPVCLADHPRGVTGFARCNARLAVWITSAVGTMACAYVFAVIALVSLPSAIRSGDPVIVVQWVSSVFLQLVLLAILAVGQQVAGAAADQRAMQTYLDAEALLHEAEQIQAHLTAQDAALAALITPSRG